MPAGAALALEEPLTGPPRGTPPAQGTKAQQACAEQSQCARLRHLRYREGCEQPMRLAVDAIVEIEGVGVTVHAAAPELKRPKATRCIAAAGVDRDRTEERSRCRVEGVDLAFDQAEITDQQVATELPKTGRGKSDAQGGGELAAIVDWEEQRSDFK